MKLQKLFNMAPSEIAFRGRQEMFKTVERVSASPAHLLPSVNEKVQLGFKESAAQRFFCGVSNTDTPEMISSYLPRVRSDIINSADAVCAGKFDTLGYGRVSFFDNNSYNAIDWHLDAVSGKVCPLLHWSRINPLDYAQVGDSKVTWELNRHQWLVELGLAWQLTKNEKYAAVFLQRIHAWMEDNPPGFGINWSSSLEVSYRLISWCWALVLFKDAKALTTSTQLSILSWLQAHARHIERYLSVYYSPNTHLTGEALGLFYAGSLFPEMREASRWRSTGRKILLEQLQRQVHVDGVYFEQSTRYQYYTVEIYLHFMILAERSGDILPDSFAERVQSMLDFLLDLRRPDGSFPQIGDNDGGALLPILHREPGDFSGLFSVAAALFRREDYAWAAGKSTPELICLLGPAGHYGFLSLKQRAPVFTPSRHYSEGGYVVMRNARRTRGHQLILDVGPLGCSDSAAHGHADLLSIQCSAFGDNYLVDAGSGNYTADPHWRNYFRSTQAHNAVIVDGLSQMEPSGPFGWRGRRPQVSVHHYQSTSDLTFVDASHDAWMGLPDPVVHRRRVYFVRQRYWVVVDDLSAQHSHQFELRFQFSPIAVALEGNGWVRARGEHGSCLLMLVVANTALELTVSTGEEQPAAGWISDNYGHKAPAPALRCATQSDAPVRFITVLMPQENANAGLPNVRTTPSLQTLGASVLNIHTDLIHHDQIVVSDDDITISQGAVSFAE